MHVYKPSFGPVVRTDQGHFVATSSHTGEEMEFWAESAAKFWLMAIATVAIGH